MAEFSREVLEYEQRYVDLSVGCNNYQRSVGRPALVSICAAPICEVVSIRSDSDAISAYEELKERLHRIEHPYEEINHQRINAAINVAGLGLAANGQSTLDQLVAQTLHVAVQPVQIGNRGKRFLKQRQTVSGIMDRKEAEVSRAQEVISGPEVIGLFGETIEKGLAVELIKHFGGKFVEIDDLVLKPNSQAFGISTIQVSKPSGAENYSVDLNISPEIPRTRSGWAYQAYRSLGKVASAAWVSAGIQDGSMLPSMGVFTEYGPDFVQSETFVNGLTMAVYQRAPYIQLPHKLGIALENYITMVLHNFSLEVEAGKVNIDSLANKSNNFMQFENHRYDLRHALKLWVANRLSDPRQYIRTAADWPTLVPVMQGDLGRITSVAKINDRSTDLLSNLLNEPQTYLQILETLGATQSVTYKKTA
jgi:hypothetical protein